MSVSHCVALFISTSCAVESGSNARDKRTAAPSTGKIPKVADSGKTIMLASKYVSPRDAKSVYLPEHSSEVAACVDGDMRSF